MQIQKLVWLVTWASTLKVGPPSSGAAALMNTVARFEDPLEPLNHSHSHSLTHPEKIRAHRHIMEGSQSIPPSSEFKSNR